MEPQIRTLVDISSTPAALNGRADMMLERAHWASAVFQRYDRQQTMAIVDAVAAAAHANAEKYAKWAVEETGFGVVEHKKLKNELTAAPLVDFYRDQDFVNPRIDERRKIVEIPRPAGVIFALTPSTNPISTLNYKIILALMTRNAIVISPHPAARESSVDAARTLSEAAVAAGAPDGVIQIIEDPSIPLIETFMSSPKANVILATGGMAVVRAAYSSSNPAIGVGPGNAPVMVDSSADLNKAAQRIVDSKSFDNSILCTNESIIITLPEVEDRLRRALKSAGAHICNEEEVERLRRFLFHERGFNIAAIGRDATWIAQECGIRVPANTRILVTPVDKIGVEERLSREKLCPVLAMHVAKNRTPGAGPGARRSAADRGRALGGDPCQRSTACHGLRGQGRSLPRRCQCSLFPGRGRLRHQSCPHIHRWHRLLRPVVNRRECRATASGSLDAHCAQRRQIRTLRRL